MIDPLKIFITVVEKQSFSKAAEALFLSQPSVSVQIQNLENSLGTKLFHRTSKLVQLTKAGEILYAHAQKILTLYEEAKQEIDLLHNKVSGFLKIGASFTIGEYVLPRVLGTYTHQYPQVEIEVEIANTDEVAERVRSNQLDIGLVEGTVDEKDLLVEAFLEDELVVIVPPEHPLSLQAVVENADLQEQVWILRESGSGTRAYSDAFFADLGVTAKRSFVFNTSQGVKEAVAAGLGIALLSCLTVQKELEHGELAALTLSAQSCTRQFSIILRKDSFVTKALEEFICLLKKSAPVFYCKAKRVT